MTHVLPPLPYAKDALSPYISAETIEYHYGKHHQAYVDNLNKLIPGTEFENLSLEMIVKTAPQGPIFNNAAQVWNHTFYWNSLTAPENRTIGNSNTIGGVVIATFGSVAALKEEFNKKAMAQFGSGWVWLIKTADGGLAIETTSNADTPLAHGKTPLFTCDVWEHAYYIDYRNKRAEYLEKFWNLVDWDAAEVRFVA